MNKPQTEGNANACLCSRGRSSRLSAVLPFWIAVQHSHFSNNNKKRTLTQM